MRVHGKGFVSAMAVGAGAAYWLRRARGRRRDNAYRSPDQPLVSKLGYGAREGDIAGLEAATLESGSKGDRPHSGVALRIAGAALLLYGLTRRGRMATTARTVGMGLLARGPRAHRGADFASPPRDRRQIVDIQKTLYVEAPVHQVYAFWSNYENFPLFMSNVREVQDLGAGRSRWSVRGPGGTLIRWDAHLTEQVANEIIAWRSEPDAMLENAGIIRFRPDGAGTRLDLRFCYRSPAGGAGQTVIDWFGVDPRAKLNEDLGRLKALLEATAGRADYGQKSRS